jgi:HEAT repeat protein
MSLSQEMGDSTRDEKIKWLTDVVEGDGSSKESVPVLKSLLGDKDPEVRKLAVTALWDYPQPGIIDSLFRVVSQDPAHDVRSQAVVTLGGFIYQVIDRGDVADYNYDWPSINGVMPDEMLSKEDFLRVKQFLIDVFHDEAQPLDTRQAAVEALSFVRGSDVTQIIREAYAGPEVEMKVSAIFAMGRNRDKIWSDVLLKELKNPNAEIQLEAARAAGECCVQEANSVLKRLVRSENSEVKLEAIWSLGRVGGPGSHRVLAACVSSDDADVREVAEAALQELERTGRGGQ